MTPDDFRRLALSLPDTREGAHMQHPDFRAAGRIFATLHQDGERGMVKVSPAQQQQLVQAHPRLFVPANGAWGRQGCTMVWLAMVDAALLCTALTDAWQVAMAQPAAKQAKAKAAVKTKAKAKAKPARRSRKTK